MPPWARARPRVSHVPDRPIPRWIRQLSRIGHGRPPIRFNIVMNNADIAWMLVSTALVLLMTPALGFFYGGMVRSKNALNTMMMSFVALGPVAVAWALLGYSLAFAPGALVIGSLAFAGLARRRPGGAGHHPAPAVHGVPGHVRHHHRGAHLGRGRRAHALQRLPRVHRAVGAGGLRAGRALGVGRRLARHGRRARLRRRRGRARERRGGRAGGRARRRPAQGLRPARDAAAQRAVHAARRRPAVVRLVRLQRRQRARREPDRRARVHQHAARAGRDAGDVDADRSRARRPRHRRRRGHGDRRRPGRR